MIFLIAISFGLFKADTLLGRVSTERGVGRICELHLILPLFLNNSYFLFVAGNITPGCFLCFILEKYLGCSTFKDFVSWMSILVGDSLCCAFVLENYSELNLRWRCCVSLSGECLISGSAYQVLILGFFFLWFNLCGENNILGVYWLNSCNVLVAISSKERFRSDLPLFFVLEGWLRIFKLSNRSIFQRIIK